MFRRRREELLFTRVLFGDFHARAFWRRFSFTRVLLDLFTRERFGDVFYRKRLQNALGDFHARAFWRRFLTLR